MGGTLTETVLWTNSNPTSSFAAQTVTLNQSITTDKFDYIKITIRISTSVATEQSYIFPTNEFLDFADGSTQNIRRGYIGTRPNGNDLRIIFSVSNTQVNFTAPLRAGSTTSSSNSIIIPLKIIGLK